MSALRESKPWDDRDSRLAHQLPLIAQQQIEQIT